MKNKFDEGFSLVEGFLAVLIISGIALIGFYVYRQSQPSENAVATTVSSSKTSLAHKVSVSQPRSQTYKSWNTVSSADTSYSVKYPKGWTYKKCDQSTLLVGPDDISSGKCNSDALAQIMITTSDGDMRDNYELKAQDYPDLDTTEVTVAGTKGHMQSGTLQTVGDSFVGPPSGTKTKQYIFVKNNKTYIFIYNQTPEFSDQTIYFDQMVTKTLKF